MKKLLCVILTAIICVVTVSASSPPRVSAASAVLIEASTGDIIYEKSAHERRPMASTTKIMTAVVAIEHADLSREVSVSDEAVGVEGSSIYLKGGEHLTLEELIFALMLESANDAATAIACEIAGSVDKFAELMNEKAAEIGLSDTNFTNPHGLDHENHYTTAHDLAVLTAYALKNETFSKIVSTYKTTIPLYGDEGTRLLLNHNKMLKTYEHAIGVKTGFTKKSGRCLVSAAEKGGMTLIAVTLSAPDDWRDHKSMLDYGFTKYERIPLADPGTVTISVPVVGGATSEVKVTNPDGASHCVPTEKTDITSVTELKRFYYAPIKAGEILGKITFYNNGKKLTSVDLASTEEIKAAPKKSWKLFG